MSFFNIFKGVTFFENQALVTHKSYNNTYDFIEINVQYCKGN